MKHWLFAVLGLLFPNYAGMAQIRYGYSGWAQIDHFEYGHHFSQGTTLCSVEAKAFHLTDAAKETDCGWLYQARTQVTTGGVSLCFDYSLHLDQTTNKEGQTTSFALDKDLPSFGWNLETPMNWQALAELLKPLLEEEACDSITPQPQIIGYTGGCGNVLITTLSPDWQKLVDESMWKAVRDMPKSIKDALIEDEERRSGKPFMVPTESRSIWYAEMQDLPSKKGTTTKLIGPAGPKLIRITGGKPIEIEGALDANNDVIYISNPHGVIVHPDCEFR